MNLRRWKYLFILIGLLYFILPIDLLPDAAGLLGRVDDLLVIAFLYSRYKKLLSQNLTSEKFRKSSTSAHAAPQEPKPKAKEAHEVLGVSSKASQSEIKQAYRRLAAEYHPDKVSHLGAELQELSSKKMLEIQLAYDKLIQERK